MLENCCQFSEHELPNSFTYMQMGYDLLISEKVKHLNRWLYIILIATTLIGLASCNLSSWISGDRNIDNQQNYEVSLQNDTDKITLVHENEQLIIIIQSAKGIGAAEIKSIKGAFPHNTLIRVFLGGLEEFVFKYDQKELQLSVPSYSGSDAQRTLRQGDEVVMIPPYTSYWMAVNYVENDDLDTGGYYEITLPPDFRAQNLDQFSISWIDYYR